MTMGRSNVPAAYSNRVLIGMKKKPKPKAKPSGKKKGK